MSKREYEILNVENPDHVEFVNMKIDEIFEDELVKFVYFFN